MVVFFKFFLLAFEFFKYYIFLNVLISTFFLFTWIVVVFLFGVFISVSGFREFGKELKYKINYKFFFNLGTWLSV